MVERGWEEVSLGEVVRLQRGHDLPQRNRRPGEVPVIGSGGVAGYHDEAVSLGPGVVIGRATNLGRPYWAPGPYWPLNTSLYVTDFLGNDPRFVFHLFEVLDLSGFNSGSVQPMLNRNYIQSVPVHLPPLDVQRRIAGVLGNLDDLIDTNLQVMQSLQRLSDALFLDAWDGYSMVEIADLGDLTMGQSPPGVTYNEDGEGLIFYQGVKDFGQDYPTPRVYCSAPSRVAQAGSILIAVRAPVGKTNVAAQDVAIGRGLAALSARLPSLARRALRVNANTFSAYQDSGTVFAAITKKDLLKVRVPAVDDVSLEERLEAIDCLHLAMWQENVQLKTARDELLPLLMSGRVVPGEVA